MENTSILEPNAVSNKEKKYIQMLDNFGISFENGIWAYSHFNYDLPRYGFKIHISAIQENVIDIGNIVLEYLVSNRYSFKITKNLDEFLNLNQGLYGYSQIGKFITVYPEQQKDINKLLFDLHLLTKLFKSIKVPSDFNFLNSDVVYYRYGELAKKSSRETSDNVFSDTRTRYIPENIENKIFFHDIKRYSELPEYLFPIKSLGGNGKSNIILSYHRDLRKYVVLKVGKYLSNLESNKFDSADRILWEYNVLKNLKDTESLVEAYEIFMLNNDICLVEEYLEGESIFEVMKNNEKLEPSLILNIRNQLLTVIRELHSKNYTLTDLSPGNIIWTQNNLLKLIDTEYFYNPTFKGIPNYRLGTKGFYNEKLIGKKSDLYSFIKIMYFINNINEFSTFLENGDVHITDLRASKYYNFELDDLVSINYEDLFLFVEENIY